MILGQRLGDRDRGFRERQGVERLAFVEVRGVRDEAAHDAARAEAASRGQVRPRRHSRGGEHRGQQRVGFLVLVGDPSRVCAQRVQGGGAGQRLPHVRVGELQVRDRHEIERRPAGGAGGDLAVDRGAPLRGDRVRVEGVEGQFVVRDVRHHDFSATD